MIILNHIHISQPISRHQIGNLPLGVILLMEAIDGRNPAPVDMVVYPINFRALYIPGGAGLLPSTVSPLKADDLFDV